MNRSRATIPDKIVERYPMGIKTIIWLLYTIIVVYSILDGIQTVMLLSLGVEEGNPIMAWLIEVTGTVYSIFCAKAAASLLLLVILVIHLGNNKKR